MYNDRNDYSISLYSVYCPHQTSPSRPHLYKLTYILLTLFPANTRCWPNAGLMLGQRLRCWPNIKPALDRRIVSHELLFQNGISGAQSFQWTDELFTIKHETSSQRWADVVDSGPTSTKHWVKISHKYILRRFPKTRYVDPVVFQSWADVANLSLTLGKRFFCCRPFTTRFLRPPSRVSWNVAMMTSYSRETVRLTYIWSITVSWDFLTYNLPYSRNSIIVDRRQTRKEDFFFSCFILVRHQHHIMTSHVCFMFSGNYPVNTIQGSDVTLMLAHRLRRWPDINPTLVEYIPCLPGDLHCNTNTTLNSRLENTIALIICT